MTLGTLVLVRHAKSSYPDGVIDHERPLNHRGRRDAAQTGHWLKEHSGDIFSSTPDVIVSTAVRAQQTWKIVSEIFVVDHVDDERLYDSAVSTLIEVVRAKIEAGVDVLVVSHNPGLEELAIYLTQGQAAKPNELALSHMPTSSIVVLKILDTEWSDQSAEVVEFVVPRS
jgi:phosphohistidine phosphatase